MEKYSLSKLQTLTPARIIISEVFTITTILEKLTTLSTSTTPVTPDILVLQFPIVSLCMVSTSSTWTLIDAGIANSAPVIVQAAAKQFGTDRHPTSIILTHGHFDHVGAVVELADHWGVPVYAHELELPYLTGQKDYPPADPTVDGGLIAEMSPLFPHHGIDLGQRVRALPADGSIPGMSGWRYIHTPGHTPGHISLFREQDWILLAGDAFTTTKQESALAVLTKKEEVSGPPAYFTTDWQAAEASVKHLADLKPSLVIPSHGLPMKGEELATHLEYLAKNFENIAIPEHGRFVH